MTFKKIKYILIQKIKTLTMYEYAILLILGLFLIFIAFYFSRTPKWITVEVKISPENYFSTWDAHPPYWLSSNLKPGDAEKNFIGEPNAIIDNIQTIEFSGDRAVIYLRLHIKTIFNPVKNLYTFKSRPATVGAPIELYINNTQLRGVISRLDTESDATQFKFTDKIVVARLLALQEELSDTFGVPQWVADGIKIGDTVKNLEGDVIAEILEKNVTPADRIVTDVNGNLYTRKDPKKVDVNLTIRIKTKQINDTFYFYDEIPIRIGSIIPLHFAHISLGPTITNILE